MLLLLISLISVSVLSAWEIPVEYSVGGKSYERFGKITLHPTDDGNFTGFFKTDLSPSTLQQQLISNINAPYKLKGANVFSSTQPCLILQSNLKHELAVAIDPVEKKLLSITVFPGGLYDVGHVECDVNELKQKQINKISTHVVVTGRSALPSPDVTSYLQRIEEEKRARQHGASQDNRSFLAKYWMYIVPAVIFLLITNAAGVEEQG